MYSVHWTYPIEILMSLKNDGFLTFDLTQTTPQTIFFHVTISTVEGIKNGYRVLCQYIDFDFSTLLKLKF